MRRFAEARLRPGPTLIIRVGRLDRERDGADRRLHHRVRELWDTAEVALLDLADAGGLSPRAAERVWQILGDQRPVELDDGTWS